MSIQEDAPPTLAYAAPAAEVSAVDRLRRVLAGFVVLYAASRLISAALTWQFLYGNQRPDFSLGTTWAQLAQTVFQSALTMAMAVGAARLFCVAPRGLMTLRVAAGSLAALTVAMQFYWRFAYPGTSFSVAAIAHPAFVATNLFPSIFSVPALICVLTFPLRGARET